MTRGMRFVVCGIAWMLSQLPCWATEPPIRLEDLLQEMIDRDALAQFPPTDFRQLQASSYNRLSTARDQPDQGVTGWFADSDGISAIREEIHDGRRESVLMEHIGPGCLTKIWGTYFYYDFNDHVGSKLRIYLDGAEQPTIEEGFIELITNNDWPAHYGPAPPRRNRLRIPAPLAEFTARAGNLYLPIPFAKSCKATLEGKPFYNIINYRAYPTGAAIESFSPQVFARAQSVMENVCRELRHPQPPVEPPLRKKQSIPVRDSLALNLPPGSGAIRSLEITVDPNQIRENPRRLRSTVLKIEFDGEATVWCPLGDFFGSANQINPFATRTRVVTKDGRMVCRWVMPYERTARVVLENFGDSPIDVELSAQVGEWKWDPRSMRFFARWRADDVVQGHQFVDWNFVDIRGQGVFVGDQWTVLNLHGDWWGEGDEKIYVDDSYDRRKFPDHFGTGTEDYYGWAGGENPRKHDQFSRPFLANILVGSTEVDGPRGFNICARERGLDAIPFKQRLVFDMEASPGTSQREPWDLLGYSAVTFWYAKPGATTNLAPSPEASTQPILALDDLDARSRLIRGADNRRLANAVEFEQLSPTAKSLGVDIEKQTPAERFHPERLSGRTQQFIHFHSPGDFVEFRLTEQFQPKRLQCYVGKCFDYGIVKLTVNGKSPMEKLDLFNDDFSVEAIDFGVVQPQENMFIVRVELVSPNPRSRGQKTYCGLDCMTITDAN